MVRVTSVQQVIDEMPQQFRAAEAGDLKARIQFDLSGEGGGQWYAAIENGVAAVHAGAVDNPNLTLSGTASDYLAVVNGDLKPLQAFMQGKVKAKGDMGLAMRLQKLFGR